MAPARSEPSQPQQHASSQNLKHAQILMDKVSKRAGKNINGYEKDM
jgi:hypothetical protein